MGGRPPCARPQRSRPVPTPPNPRRHGRATEPTASPADDCGELAAPRADEPPEPDEPLVCPGDAPELPCRRTHLGESARAVGPLDLPAYLDARPPRRSGLSDRAEIREYHRRRAQTRGHEALTPGADLLVTLLSLARPQPDGHHRLTPGHFATTSAEILYSPSYGPVEKYVWTYLFDHRDYDAFRTSGLAVVSTVRRTDLAACAGVCEGTIAEAIHGLMAKGRLTRKLRGQGRPAVYTLPALESGASVYPAGHNRSARRRLLALLRRAADDPSGSEAHALAETLGLPLADLQRRDLAGLLFRRLARATETALSTAAGARNGCPHPVDSPDSDPQDLRV